MLNPEIQSSEKLYRVVKINSNLWNLNNNRPSSALFKDSKGVSVDRDGDRDEANIIKNYLERFTSDKVKAVVYVEASFCFELPVVIKYNPIQENIYHSLIIQSEDKIELSSSIAKKLAMNSRIVYPL